MRITERRAEGPGRWCLEVESVVDRALSQPTYRKTVTLSEVVPPTRAVRKGGHDSDRPRDARDPLLTGSGFFGSASWDRHHLARRGGTRPASSSSSVLESLVDAPPGISGLLALGKLVTVASPVSTRRQATRRPPDTPLHNRQTCVMHTTSTRGEACFLRDS